MSETIEQTWEQELLAEGEARGQLREDREILRELLEEKFGTLPETLIRRIELTPDSERLRQCIRQVVRIKDLAELDL